MIFPTNRIVVATKPVDFRKGHDGLAMLVQKVLSEDLFSGHLFAFRGRKASLIKILFWDGPGSASSPSVEQRATVSLLGSRANLCQSR